MAEQQVLGVQEGIWIDKSWLKKAGLGSHLQITVQQGEIRIIAAPETVKPSESSEEAWSAEAVELFCSLGRNAIPGRLKDTSVNHDLYLYGRTE